MAIKFIFVGLLAIFLAVALAADPNPLQDFCVADPNSSTVVNGKACKDPRLATASDFFLSGLHLAGNTSNAFGSRVTPVVAAQVPGLNTLGISMARIDIAPGGVNPLHVHPRATEIFTVIEGTVEVGFISLFRLITKILKQGDVFVFPEGLVHYQKNIGNGNAYAIAALNSQNPGASVIANVVFGSKPSISTDILTKAFGVDEKTISLVQSRFQA